MVSGFVFVYDLRLHSLHRMHVMNLLVLIRMLFAFLSASTGGLQPVKVSLPSIFEEEDEDPSLSAARKGKRKAE